MEHNELIGLFWGTKETLRSHFKESQWGNIILPFVVLRRIESVLEPTKKPNWFSG